MFWFMLTPTSQIWSNANTEKIGWNRDLIIEVGSVSEQKPAMSPKRVRFGRSSRKSVLRLAYLLVRRSRLTFFLSCLVSYLYHLPG